MFDVEGVLEAVDEGQHVLLLLLPPFSVLSVAEISSVLAHDVFDDLQ